MRNNRYGKNAVVLGEVVPGKFGRVAMKTRLGTTRVVEMLSGATLPRIC